MCSTLDPAPTAAVAATHLDHTGTVQMDRVDWNATQDYDCLKNFKLLQKAFDKNGIDKVG